MPCAWRRTGPGPRLTHLRQCTFGRGAHAVAEKVKREQSAIEQRVLHFQYFSASRGVLEFRNVSVHRVFAGPPIRFELQVYVRRLARGL